MDGDEKYLHLTAELGKEVVESLHKKTVTIVGLGGIGSALSEMLVRSGIGVRLIEKDRIFEEDIDRLSLFTEADITKFKATQAKKILTKINSDANVKSFNEEITEDALFLVDAHMVILSLDDQELLEMISAYCFKQKIPCAYGGVRDKRCIIITGNDKKAVHEQLATVKIEKTEGLLPSYTHLAASFLFIKVIKTLTGHKVKRGILVYDAWKQQFEDVRGKKK